MKKAQRKTQLLERRQINKKNRARNLALGNLRNIPVTHALAIREPEVIETRWVPKPESLAKRILRALWPWSRL
jgi:hypothetical protein